MSTLILLRVCAFDLAGPEEGFSSKLHQKVLSINSITNHILGF